MISEVISHEGFGFNPVIVFNPDNYSTYNSYTDPKSDEDRNINKLLDQLAKFYTEDKIKEIVENNQDVDFEERYDSQLKLYAADKDANIILGPKMGIYLENTPTVITSNLPVIHTTFAACNIFAEALLDLYGGKSAQTVFNVQAVAKYLNWYNENSFYGFSNFKAYELF